MSLEQPKEVLSYADLAQTLSAANKERLDYILNHIDETEKSLEMADDQPAVIAALKEVFEAESDREAIKVAKEKLQDLL